MSNREHNDFSYRRFNSRIHRARICEFIPFYRNYPGASFFRKLGRAVDRLIINHNYFFFAFVVLPFQIVQKTAQGFPFV
jgi:hypothetical protein